MNPGKEPLCFTSHADGVIFSIRAQPGARKSGFQGMLGESAKLAVAAPPEDGKANEALVELIADLFQVRKSRIELIHGKLSRHKRFLIRELDRNQALELWQKVTESKS